MNDFEQRIRHALAVRAERAPVAEREWAEQTVLEETAAQGSPGGSPGRRQLALGFATILAAVATVAAAFAAAGVLGGRDHPVSITNQPAVGTLDNGGCHGSTRVARGQQADNLGGGIRFLPTWLPKGKKITFSQVQVEWVNAATCTSVPTALVLIDRAKGDAQRIERAATLFGPAKTPYAHTGNGPVSEPIQVRGVTGTLTRTPLPANTPAGTPSRDGYYDTMTVDWTERDGTSWSLEATHVAKEELVAMADGFVLNPAGTGPVAIVAGSESRVGNTDVASRPTTPALPAGFEVAWQTDNEGPGVPRTGLIDFENIATENIGWYAHTNRGGGAADFDIRIEHSFVATPAVGMAVAGVVSPVELVSVRGHPAVHLPGALIWDEYPGARVELRGNTDLPTLLRVAESFALVPPEDAPTSGSRRIRWILVPVGLVLAAVTVFLARQLGRRRRGEV